ncbi:MAG: Asp23/Gls24 family envelope stress response protein [Tissierellia bacterium]|nr:Asp23/Gls24 family envelope stress response protein [Tissierellia bacterium]
MNEGYIDSRESNQIKISNEVIASIATLAAGKVEGVAGMIGTLTGDMVEKLGVKSQAKGAKVECDGNQCYVDLTVNLKYGVNIVKVCKEVQEEVSKSIELMTGLQTANVNVIVAGIQIPKSAKKDTDKR